MVEAKQIQRHYTTKDLADLDVKTSVNKIGEIINLSQKLNSILWHKLNNGADFEAISDIYTDICQLSVMSNIEIDKAKREFDVDNVVELNKLSQKYKLDETGNRTEPYFLGVIAKRKSKHKKYKNCFNNKKKYIYMDTAMDYLEYHVLRYRKPKSQDGIIPFSDIINFKDYSISKVWYPQVHRIIEEARNSRAAMKEIWSDSSIDDKKIKFRLCQQIRENMINNITKTQIGLSSMLYLIKSIEQEANSDIRNQIIDSLFGLRNSEFYKLLQISKESTKIIKPCQDGEIIFYGLHYTYK